MPSFIDLTGVVLEINRENNERGYSKDNCKWATRTQQTRNTRSNHRLMFGGKSYTVAEWSEITGIAYRTILGRLARGWAIERTLTERVGRT